ncbi:MAG: hypothetical protein VW831_18230, partial [Gammaproteobacteria bacterium]
MRFSVNALKAAMVALFLLVTFAATASIRPTGSDVDAISPVAVQGEIDPFALNPREELLAAQSKKSQSKTDVFSASKGNAKITRETGNCEEE